MLHTWARQVRERGRNAFESLSERTDPEAELTRLREEVRVLRMERDILKKAATFFAKKSR